MISEFQFVAVLVAIIFGLSLTHVMSSGVRVMLSGLGERPGGNPPGLDLLCTDRTIS